MKEIKPDSITVIITNPVPVSFLNEPCTHRAVTIQLTEKQCDALALHVAGYSNGDIYEMYGTIVINYSKEGKKVEP